MSDRELFKILKKMRLFSTFYLACAQAWWRPEYYKAPRTQLREYLEGTAKKLIIKRDCTFIEAIQERWKLDPNAKLI
jgi:hypothetical protein